MRRFSGFLPRGVVLLVVLLVVALSACADGAPKVDWQVEISGAVDQPVSLSYGELAGMSQVEIEDVLMVKSRGEDEITSWSGVPLEEVLAKAGVQAGYVVITAVAADGYAVEISRDELEGAIIALKTSGEWIATVDAEHGPIRLVCPHTPANRWLFQLVEIEVVGP